MNFSNIPSDCILLIFNRIPLYDLLFTTNLVCRQWNALQPAACLRKRVLKLQIGSRAQSILECSLFNNRLVDSSDFNLLRFRELSTRIALNISTKLPNIRGFQLDRKYLTSSELHLLNRVLDHWSSSLVSIKLYIQPVYNLHVASQMNLFCILNRMPKLKNLTLDLGNSRILDQLESFLVLFQLDHIQFNSADLPDKLLGWLKSNEKQAPKRIGFGEQMKFSGVVYRQFWSLSNEISTRITHLPLRSYYLEEPENLGQWYFKFLALESIKIQEKRIEMSKVSNQIKPLNQLAHLHILTNEFSDDQPESSSPVFQQFSSVKVIELDLSPSDGDLHLDAAQFHHYFPSVEVVKVRLYTKVDEENIRSCLEQLKKCTLLKHISLFEVPRGTGLNLTIDKL